MQIDFYVIENASRMQALRELCLLLEKCNAEHQSVYVHVANTGEADQLDKLMWTYRDDNFLAHNLVSEGDAPIQIGIEPPNGNIHTLVNLTDAIPAFYTQFQRVIEIVYQDPAIQNAGRDRFRQYREHGQTLQTYKMKVSAA